MSDFATVIPAEESQPSRIWGALLALAGGVALFIFVLFLGLLSYQVMHGGQMFPGVSVGGVDVSGLTPDEATQLLADRLEYTLSGRIAFQDGDRFWTATPLEVGLFLDAETSARAAYRVGRFGGPFRRLAEQFSAWYRGVELAPRLVYDERSAQRYLSELAAQVDRPVIEAELGLSGIEVQVRSGQIGRTVDVEATLEALGPQLVTMTDGIIPLVVEETPPIILDVSEQAELARRILSAPLTLHVPDPREGDPGPWTFDPQALAQMLSIELVGPQGEARYQVALDTADLRVFFETLAPDMAIDPVNARVIFNDDTRELEVIESAVIGRQLKIDETVAAVNEGLGAGKHDLDLVFETQKPEVTDEVTAAELGITELINAETSYFYGSSGSRIQNIATAAGRFHGLLVPPGATFSMAEALGDVSLDNGYAEALIIYGDRTIKGVGGGVCQVSTTLFRNVFFSGFPVAERHQHAYRVYYYELTAGNRHDPTLAGLDATVYVPLVDFQFTNDSPYWLLMETYVDQSARTLTWKFYSTSDGRHVEWQTSGLQNRVDPPEPLYQENPDLAKGEIRQIDWAVEGADVTVTRAVFRNGETHLQDSFHTHYVPWRAIYEYGPGTEGIPTPEPEGEPVG